MLPAIPKDILKPLLSNLAKGGAGALLVILVWAWQSWKQENRLDYNYQLERYEVREAAYLETIESQASELKALQKGFYFLSSSRRQSPLPEWAKAVSGHFQWKNEAFDRWLLLPNNISPDSVLFRTDLEVWPDKDLARSYRQNDLQVIQENRVVHTIEHVRIGAEIAAWHTWKYPLHNAMGSVIGVGGVAVRDDELTALNINN
ncbi:MAG: PAS domain-containing protein [Bacteroidota bacterium]